MAGGHILDLFVFWYTVHICSTNEKNRDFRFSTLFRNFSDFLTPYLALFKKHCVNIKAVIIYAEIKESLAPAEKLSFFSVCAEQ